MKRSSTRTEATSPPVRTRRARDAVEEASGKAVGCKDTPDLVRCRCARHSLVGGTPLGTPKPQPLASLPWGLPVDLGTAGHLLPSLPWVLRRCCGMPYRLLCVPATLVATWRRSYTIVVITIVPDDIEDELFSRFLGPLMTPLTFNRVASYPPSAVL
ncbi:hypothetical protein BHE74_00040840 [Ensete ventricosum]|nr:hypothetical protein BHE74_00040840 [Ensete ventricosum]